MKPKCHRLLEQLAFSANLPTAAIVELAAIASPRHYSAGQILFREGSASETLYVIVNGRVALDMHVPGRGGVRVMSLGPGDMLGWSAVIGQGQMTATASMIDDSELLAFAGSQLLELCQRNPEVGYLIMRQLASALSNRLLATRLQLLDLFGDHPRQA